MSLFIGLLSCHCRIFGSTSLKEKRRVLQSVQTRIRQRFNLSVAEIDLQNDRQIAELAFVGVGSSQRVIEQELRKASQLLEQTVELEILDAQIIWR